MLRSILRGVPSHPFALIARIGTAVGCSLALASCGATASESQSPGRSLPPYAGHSLELFDDAIEPTAVGFNLGANVSPDRDQLLRERARVGDAVVRARVATVTSRDESRGRSWQVGLHTVERVTGSGPLPPDFTLNVESNSPTSGILRAFESRLIGKTFVAFVREFAPAGSAERPDSDLHFHLAHDGTDEVNAVLAAALQGSVR